MKLKALLGTVLEIFWLPALATSPSGYTCVRPNHLSSLLNLLIGT